MTDNGSWLRGRIVYRDGKPAGIADAEMAPMLGADGKPLAARGWYDTESLAERRRHVLCRHRARREDRALRLSPRRACGARRADRGAGGIQDASPTTRASNAWPVPPKGSPLAGNLIVVTERSLDSAGNHRSFLLKRRRGRRASPSSAATISTSAIAPCCRRPICCCSSAAIRWRAASRMRIRRIPLAAHQAGRAGRRHRC